MLKLNVGQVIEPGKVEAIAQDIRDAGGRALIIGGFVRDHFLGVSSKDIDIEVFGLVPDVLETVLGRHGEVLHMGRAFGIIQVKGLPIDFSLPRRDSKTGPGHKGFDVELDPHMDHTEASRRRDLTISCMGWDPLTGELLDPFGGQQDIADRRLRVIDRDLFPEDPLRALRVAQFSARFSMKADAETFEVCRGLDLTELAGERVLEEFRKLLLRGVEPSLGLDFLKSTELIRFFPELHALVGCDQDKEWHPEGDVWRHTCMVVDAAAKIRDEVEDPEALMFGALCHDLGKPETSEWNGEHITSHGHNIAGVPLTEQLLGRMRVSKALMKKVQFLVEAHLQPGSFVNSPTTTPKAYRRLARKADEAGANLKLLEALCRADRLGTTTEKALTLGFPEGAVFLERARELKVEEKVEPPAVLGRHLIARGMKPGREFGPILAQCRDIQDEFGWTDPAQILDKVLAA